jgi:predicted AlkP superfamily pyrophosphatase or phosphodiesterase
MNCRTLIALTLLVTLLPAALARGAESTVTDAAGASGAIPGSSADPIVIVLSWDGMRHDYLDRAEFPALDRVAEQGVRADRLVPVFPSSTFPGHVSMATGTYPDRHGIVDNVFMDETRGRYAYSGDADWIDAEPVWIAAERQGVKTATYFWVGSESNWRGQGTSYRIAPFDGGRPEPAKVDQILDWLALDEAARPRLIMSYWAGADGVGHDEGPDSETVVEQIRAQDESLARLLAGIDEQGLWDRTTLMVVSDHGMAACTHYLDLNGALADAGIEAQAIGAAVAQVHLADDADLAAAGGVLEDFLADVPGAVWFQRERLPPEFRLGRDDRLGEWIVVLQPPYAFYRPTAMQALLSPIARWLGVEFGMHGYDPGLSDMGAILLAMGSGVPEGLTLGEVRQIDLAATIATLLGIDPPRDSEGSALWPIPKAVDGLR